jgi:hypothetical protein
VSAPPKPRGGFRAPLPRRLSIAAIVVGLGLATPSLAPAQTAPSTQVDIDYETAKNAYAAKEYVEAEARLQKVVDPSSGLKAHEKLLDAQMALGGCKLLRATRTVPTDPLTDAERARKKIEADELFAKIILDDPDYKPSPFDHPVAVLDQFTIVRTKLRDVLNQRAIAAAKEKARLEQLEKDLKAQQEAYVKLLEAQAQQTVEHHSRWLALVPFGVGQYQNGKVALGTLFLGLESALVIGTGVTFVMYRLDISRGAEVLAGDSTSRDRLQIYQQYSDRASDIRIVNLVLVGAAALTAAIGIIEAQVNYVPDAVTSTKRPLPNKPPLPTRSAWVVPTFVPIVTEQGGFGGSLGIAGTF